MMIPSLLSLGFCVRSALAFARLTRSPAYLPGGITVSTELAVAKTVPAPSRRLAFAKPLRRPQHSAPHRREKQYIEAAPGPDCSRL